MHHSKYVIGLIMLFLSLPLLASSTDHHRHHANQTDYRQQAQFAKVVFVAPVYKTVSVESPQLECRSNQRRRDSNVTLVRQRSPENIIIGGLIGGVIGHELGNPSNNTASTLAGVLIGSAIANNTSTLSYHYSDYSPEPHIACSQQIRIVEQQILTGYLVKYKYRGNIYTTHLDSHPGDRIRIRPEYNSGTRSWHK